jgi:hypothetical protein
LSCGGFLVGLGMLFIPQLRGQAGRMLLSALCLESVIAAFGVVIMNDVGFFKDAGLGVGVDAFFASVPPALIAVAGVCLQIGALIGMRHLVPWGIEVRRRMA